MTSVSALSSFDHTSPRSLRLKALTRDVHEKLDNAIMAWAPFDNIEGYTHFLDMQYRFHRDIDALYDDERLRALLPDLAVRRRLPVIIADLGDLDIAPPALDTPPAFTADTVDVPAALGWLYVAEGSNMGAAILRKMAVGLGLSDDHGARHLAPAGEGPAAHWRAFTAALDTVELTPEEDARTAQQAQEAFDRVWRHAQAVFA
ncbi:biliverdin-producing heme oxygenase [Pseudochelatococcus contaminans]|uniref:Heme oxygenase n=1 Tax=Pseudochelatococcus contaminans TaxID=1538103 RepID=A0A7W5Z1T6_9HYPH|nr:biliverdin-producing heme oxygenase [Pseudochelatococcus contaminans]MBB3808508.1 heme oxygenase [Pseudochelatococcus contaminans]